MKNKGKFWGLVGMIATLIIGFFIGIAVNYPKIDTSTVSGTIAKISKYRNTQSSISEVDLKNVLVSDTAQLRAAQNYLKYFYTSTVRMSADIQFALREANAIPAFKASNQSRITELANYEKYLSSVRTDLLLALTTYQEPDKSDASLLMDLFNQVNNVVAQINYRNQVVLEFTAALASYAEDHKLGDIEGLKTAHDLLTLNELKMAVVTKNKILLKYLDKSTLLSNVKTLKQTNHQNMDAIFQQDSEKLGRLMDSEKLNDGDGGPGYNRLMDSEKLGRILDSEKLGSLLLDSEKLGSLLLDSEKLGLIVFDSEKLGFLDTEKLGLDDSEKLKLFR